MSEQGPVVCPTCRGAKRNQAFVDGIRNGKRFGELRTLDCHTCQGKGEITEDHAERIRKGMEMRADRLSRGLSGRQEAERLGISAIELNRQEHGRLPDE